MPMNNTGVVLLDATLSPSASGSRGAPGAMTAGGYFDNRGNWDSPLGIVIKNDTIAPGSPLIVVVQVSDDTITWTDYYELSGDTLPYNASTMAGVVSRTINLDKVCYVRVIAFGNTSQAVEVRARLHSVRVT